MNVFEPHPDDPAKVRHKPVNCRVCGSSNDGATHSAGVAGEQPKNGDVSLCMICGEISVFVVGPLGFALREPSLDELAAITRDHVEVIEARRAWRAEHPRNPWASDPDA